MWQRDQGSHGVCLCVCVCGGGVIKTSWSSAMRACFQSMWGLEGKAYFCSGSAPTGNLSHLEPCVWPEQDFSSNESGRASHSQTNCTLLRQNMCFVSDVRRTIPRFFFFLFFFFRTRSTDLRCVRLARLSLFWSGVCEIACVHVCACKCAFTGAQCPCVCICVWRTDSHSQWSIHLRPGTRIGSPVEKDRDWERDCSDPAQWLNASCLPGTD